MRRREFLIRGAAAAAGPIVARAAAFAAPVVTAAQPGALASAHVIWSATTASVRIQAGGTAARIASSTNGKANAETPDLHCVFAKEITLSAVPSLAVLHLFAFTRYRLYLNGSYIGRGPGRYQNQRPEYDSRDIRSRLRPGRNLMVVLVHRDAPTGRIMLHDPGFVAALEMMHGGRRRVVATDSSWLSMAEISFGARAQAWSSVEEHIDARKVDDWTRPDLSLPIWQPSAIVPGSGDIRFLPRSSPLQSETERSWSSGAPAVPIVLSAGGEVEFSLPEIAQALSCAGDGCGRRKLAGGFI